MDLDNNSFEAAVVQFASSVGNPSANVDRALAMVSDMLDNGRNIKLIVLPEGFDVGYDLDYLRSADLPAPPQSLGRIKEFASRHGLCVVYGSIERVSKGVVNFAQVVLPDGRVARYEKSHLFSTDPLLETDVFTLGDGKLVVVPFEGINIGVQICYDVRFPEMARSLCLAGADVICMPAAWPAVRRDIWRTLTIARAMENQIYVLAANQAPLEGGVEFAGTSLIVGPDGRVILEAEERGEKVMVTLVDIASQRKTREFIPLWKHRRPEIYRLDSPVSH